MQSNYQFIFIVQLKPAYLLFWGLLSAVDKRNCLLSHLVSFHCGYNIAVCSRDFKRQSQICTNTGGLNFLSLHRIICAKYSVMWYIVYKQLNCPGLRGNPHTNFFFQSWFWFTHARKAGDFVFNLLVQFGLEKQPQVRVLAYELLA